MNEKLSQGIDQVVVRDIKKLTYLIDLAKLTQTNLESNREFRPPPTVPIPTLVATLLYTLGFSRFHSLTFQHPAPWLADERPIRRASTDPSDGFQAVDLSQKRAAAQDTGTAAKWRWGRTSSMPSFPKRDKGAAAAKTKGKKKVTGDFIDQAQDAYKQLNDMITSLLDLGGDM